MTYHDAIEYLFGLQKYGIKFGLSKTSNLMKSFGNPHHGQVYVHIAGTNGKGSVAALLETILINSGLKVGFYSSPHLVRFTERFRINKQEIKPDLVARVVEELRGVIDTRHPPTFFEVTTAMALIYFAREMTDISIMEVGMGGRLDATNIVRPIISVITNISLEHQFFLGRRLIDIAGEKAGIIKRGVDLVTAATQPSVIKLFKDICAKKKAPFWRVGEHARFRKNGRVLNYYGIKHTFKGLELGLLGRFQARNAALSLAVTELLEMKGYDISSQNIRDGLKHTTWPGRMHVVSRKPLTILDGAHNPGAIRELASTLERDFKYGRLILVLGIMGDKDIDKMIKTIVSKADFVIYTRPDYYRSADPAGLRDAAKPLGKPGEIIRKIPDALNRAKEMAGPQDLILICGSLFTVGEAMAYFDSENYRPDGI
jgi:dihydrofolate synthase / folylpolyglutamate synthase